MTRDEARIGIQKILSDFQAASGEKVEAVRYEEISVYGQDHKVSRIVIETDVPVVSKEAPHPEGDFVSYVELVERNS